MEGVEYPKREQHMNNTADNLEPGVSAGTDTSARLDCFQPTSTANAGFLLGKP